MREGGMAFFIELSVGWHSCLSAFGLCSAQDDKVHSTHENNTKYPSYRKSARMSTVMANIYKNVAQDPIHQLANAICLADLTILQVMFPPSRPSS